MNKRQIPAISKVECDYCKHEFNLRTTKIRKGSKKDIRYEYFTCPNCKMKFVTVIRTLEIEAMFAQMANIVMKEGPTAAADKLKYKIKAKQAEIRKELEAELNEGNPHYKE